MNNNTQLFRWVDGEKRTPTNKNTCLIRTHFGDYIDAWYNRDSWYKKGTNFFITSKAISVFWLEEYTPEPTATSHSVKDVEGLADNHWDIVGTNSENKYEAHREGFREGYKAAQSSPIEESKTCGKCQMLGDAAPCDECYIKGNTKSSVSVHEVKDEISIQTILNYMAENKYNQTNPVLYSYVASFIIIQEANTKEVKAEINTL